MWPVSPLLQSGTRQPCMQLIHLPYNSHRWVGVSIRTVDHLSTRWCPTNNSSQYCIPLAALIGNPLLKKAIMVEWNIHTKEDAAEVTLATLINYGDFRLKSPAYCASPWVMTQHDSVLVSTRAPSHHCHHEGNPTPTNGPPATLHIAIWLMAQQ